MINNVTRRRGREVQHKNWFLGHKTATENPAAVLGPHGCNKVKAFPTTPRHNWYDVYRRLAGELRSSGGVLVSNDTYDLIMLTRFNIPKKVVQIVHDAYNIKLAIQFETVVDAFICHSLFYYETLRQLLYYRREDIFYIPYGIPLAGAPRISRRHDRPLRLLYLGRHDINKGVFDLYAIHRLLLQKNVPVDWMILGKGPETDKLKEQWKEEKAVQFHTPLSNEELFPLAAGNDIFVFPTKFEGFPVALIETMSLGCVPVVSDLPGGVRELVHTGETGFRCPPDDPAAFAGYIEKWPRKGAVWKKWSKRV